MRKLFHNNIIRLYEVYEGQNNVYLVMDLLKGGELFDNIVENKFQSEKNTYDTIIQLFKALDYLED